MNYLKLSLCALALALHFSANAASVRLYFINPDGDVADTNSFLVRAIGPNVLSSGGVVTRGVPIRVTPSADGVATNSLSVGHYSVSNSYLGQGIVIRVPEDATATVHDYTNLMVSGYNTFVTVAPTSNNVVTALGYSPLKGVAPGSNVTTATNAGVVTVSAAGGGAATTNASELTTGTLADARMSSNVPLKNGNNTFTGVNGFGSDVVLSNDVPLHIGGYFLTATDTNFSINLASGPVEFLAHDSDSDTTTFQEKVTIQEQLTVQSGQDGYAIAQTGGGSNYITGHLRSASNIVATAFSGDGSGLTAVDDDAVAFDDADGLWTATTVGPALEEMNESINSGTPNGSGAKVHWSQLLGVPAGFADGADATGGGGDTLWFTNSAAASSISNAYTVTATAFKGHGTYTQVQTPFGAGALLANANEIYLGNPNYVFYSHATEGRTIVSSPTTASANMILSNAGTITFTGTLNGNGSGITGVNAATGDSATAFFSAGTIEIARGGTGASLVDPNADRFLFWDDSAGAFTFGTFGSGLSLADTTLTATAGGDAFWFTNSAAANSISNTFYVKAAALTVETNSIKQGWIGDLTITNALTVDSVNATTLNVDNANIDNYNVTDLNATNFYAQTLYATNLYAQTNLAAYTSLTNEFVVGTRYTNAAHRALVSASFHLISAVGGTPKLSLKVEQGNGITNIYTIQGLTNIVQTMMMPIVAPVGPTARFTFVNESSGSASAAIISYTSSYNVQ